MLILAYAAVCARLTMQPCCIVTTMQQGWTWCCQQWNNMTRFTSSCCFVSGDLVFCLSTQLTVVSSFKAMDHTCVTALSQCSLLLLERNKMHTLSKSLWSSVTFTQDTELQQMCNSRFLWCLLEQGRREPRGHHTQDVKWDISASATSAGQTGARKILAFWWNIWELALTKRHLLPPELSSGQIKLCEQDVPDASSRASEWETRRRRRVPPLTGRCSSYENK